MRRDRGSGAGCESGDFSFGRCYRLAKAALSKQSAKRKPCDTACQAVFKNTPRSGKSSGIAFQGCVPKQTAKRKLCGIGILACLGRGRPRSYPRALIHTPRFSAKFDPGPNKCCPNDACAPNYSSQAQTILGRWTLDVAQSSTSPNKPPQTPAPAAQTSPATPPAPPPPRPTRISKSAPPPPDSPPPASSAATAHPPPC